MSRFGMREARAWAEVHSALEFMRDCGDRPGMYESAERALASLDVLCPEPEQGVASAQTADAPDGEVGPC